MADSNANNGAWNPIQGIIDLFTKGAPYDESELPQQTSTATQEQPEGQGQASPSTGTQGGGTEGGMDFEAAWRKLVSDSVPSKYVEETADPSIYAGSPVNNWYQVDDGNGGTKLMHTTPQSISAHDEAQDRADYILGGGEPTSYSQAVAEAKKTNAENETARSNGVLEGDAWRQSEIGKLQDKQRAELKEAEDATAAQAIMDKYDNLIKHRQHGKAFYLEDAEVPGEWNTLSPEEKYQWISKDYAPSEGQSESGEGAGNVTAEEPSPVPEAAGTTAQAEGESHPESEAAGDLAAAEATGDPTVLHSKLYESWKSDDRSYYTKVGSELYSQYTQAQETFNGYVPYPDIADFLLYATPDEWYDWEQFATDACGMYSDHVGEDGAIDYDSMLGFYQKYKSELTLDKIASGQWEGAIDYLGIDYNAMNSLFDRANEMYGTSIDPHAVYANAFLNDSVTGPKIRYAPEDYDRVLGAYYDIAPGDQGIVGTYAPGSQYSAQGNIKNLADSANKTLWDYYDEGGTEGVKAAVDNGSFGNVLQSLSPEDQVALGMFIRGYGFSDALPGLGNYTA